MKLMFKYQQMYDKVYKTRLGLMRLLLILNNKSNKYYTKIFLKNFQFKLIFIIFIKII